MNALQFQKKLLSMQENMMNFALMLTADRDDAQDLMQDTTLKVLNNQEKFVDNVNFKGWVLTVMRNLFINNYHKIVRTQTIIDQNADLYNLDVINDAGIDSPDGAYRIQEITKAIDALEEDLRIPFSLYLSGFKYHEIAEKLALPLGTIKSRIYFARQELQAVLKDYKR
ncbi:RNA polymerase sigma factor (sigma-70 family) [Parabacteroides sp. PFB2-12]|uniref:RNA polymerase sigma factor n=1 Tax=unclassified Parabacteroides TaxID=2649774 RepID=UPI0024758915|nr:MULTISPECIES: RNA polymerase sigma factor [unclassified Parabacteroides]MDH6341975.1 RNA polymerase sigma factor (sigma-70 family) [Parabacteroides sp. PM6-13]MDH6389673.1 RNA polymerase sigma factor (sigma-70 family) [Parabacteroides sp. PFB2-12]